jgi:hypothetical protein
MDWDIAGLVVFGVLTVLGSGAFVGKVRPGFAVLGVFPVLAWEWVSIPLVSADLCVLTAAICALPLPITTVLWWNLRGVLVGSLFVLCSGLVLRRVGTALDPTFHGPLVTYGAALVFWIVGVVFCFLIYGLKKLATWLLSRKKPAT